MKGGNLASGELRWNLEIAVLIISLSRVTVLLANSTHLPPFASLGLRPTAYSLLLLRAPLAFRLLVGPPAAFGAGTGAPGVHERSRPRGTRSLACVPGPAFPFPGLRGPGASCSRKGPPLGGSYGPRSRTGWGPQGRLWPGDPGVPGVPAPGESCPPRTDDFPYNGWARPEPLGPSSFLASWKLLF
jgi:hypothetical protein